MTEQRDATLDEVDTPRCNALARNPLDSFDHRAWASLAVALERDLEVCRDAHMANCLAADTLRTEIRDLRDDMERGMANHNADLNASALSETPLKPGLRADIVKRLRDLHLITCMADKKDSRHNETLPGIAADIIESDASALSAIPRSMDTAPKDEHGCLAYSPSFYQDKGGWVAAVWIENGCASAWHANPGGWRFNPTHWLPLPEKP